MIITREDLKYYLECDRIALRQRKKRPSLFGDEIWKFQICLRKLEYFHNQGGVEKLSFEILLPSQVSSIIDKIGVYHSM